jgi:putative colanic acid biosynthesis glycosyltransferase WcaI
MRILIHGINYHPEQIGIGKYTGEMAIWLAKRGHDVHVVTALPYYPSWQVAKEYAAWQYRRETQSGVSVFRCPLWVPSNPTALKRLIHLASFAISSFPVMVKHIIWKPDIVLVIEPPLFCAPQAWLTSRIAGAKSWLHVQDFEVSAFFGLGFASSGFLKKIIVKIEGLLMHRFDLVSSISHTMLQRLEDLHVSKDRTFLFPNWVDTGYIHPSQKENDLRSAWGFSADQKIILYSGNLGKKQGLEVILDAAEGLVSEYPEAVFLIVGDGAAKNGLVDDATRRKLHNVRFKPLQPIEKLPVLLALADIHLIIQKRGAADAVMPSKLTGILAVGGFSIITADDHTELGTLVLNNPGIAELVEPENSDALIAAIKRLLCKPVSVPYYNHIAREYAERNLSTDSIITSVETRIFQLAASGRKE